MKKQLPDLMNIFDPLLNYVDLANEKGYIFILLLIVIVICFVVLYLGFLR